MNFEVIICKQKTQNEPKEEEAVEEKPAIIFRLVLMRKRVKKKHTQNKRERNVNNAYHSDERQLSNITPQLEPQHKRG